ncbi:uncharacterized protein EKO05_0008003 [Ascochyta rabiei]|uniref:Uncharacterized protein n=1 Tax=Didymella rabiei TaxID=5454 RepID=A0A163B9I7_DIDRA|nr:uncharacterized protein EKO05_0008003 [Ascochyta rabiei]KZM21640.1 hypothetical protein ST47_g7248 [Ascochyta rabiei]UPX17662.1 hypothetical protein EKO05_0008003 [Ascochyta rabiei]
MAPPRAYIPSAALIRALTRPQPAPCPFARALPAQFVRGKKSKAAKAREAERAQLARQARRERHVTETEQKALEGVDKGNQGQTKKTLKDRKLAAATGPLGDLIAKMNDEKEMDKLLMRPPSENITDNDDDLDIDFYEQDIHTGARRKVDRFGTVAVGTAADRNREKETLLMIEEEEKDPNFDDAELNRRLMDGLMADPAFADLTEELKEIKESILTKQEIKKMEEQADKDAQPTVNEMNASMRMAIHEAVTELLNDPDIGDAKEDLQAVLDKMPEMMDVDDPEYQALIDRAMSKVNSNEKMQEKMKAGHASETVEDKQNWVKFEKDMEDLLAPEEEDYDEHGMPAIVEPEELQKVMLQMRDIMKDLNVSGDIKSELDRMVAEPLPTDEGDEVDENGFNFNEDTDPAQLAAELTKLAASKLESPPTPDSEAEDEEHIPPELQAKVDKIMEDPRLMEKLVYIQKLIAEHTPKKDPNDLTQIDHELAPDPYELEDSRTATLAQRMAAARADPEHSAALRRLRVRLQPPFNISPALKSFNQALEFAYIGANDDVRRVLWRSYQKARSLPTFLANLSDEAWDILYYSQAVTWSGNQNRTAHLKMLLADLQKVGRSGPPTHPSTLGQQAGETVETQAL